MIIFFNYKNKKKLIIKVSCFLTNKSDLEITKLQKNASNSKATNNTWSTRFGFIIDQLSSKNQ